MTPQNPQPGEISARDAERLVADGALLLDVREPDEWDAGHAPQALHMPMGTVPARAEELPRDRTIVCVCHVGGRSAAVAEALRGAGWEAVNLSGGMLAWAAAGLPVVDSAGGPGVAG